MAKDVLATAYDKLISLNQDLLAARIELIGSKDEIANAKDEVAKAKDAHRTDAMELAAAEMREMGTKTELERALEDLTALQRRPTPLHHPWWRRR